MSLEWLLIPVLASDAEGIWVLNPLAAILAGSSYAIVKSRIRHRERMAKIGMGMNPDSSSETDWTRR
jgi:hypothetical protein